MATDTIAAFIRDLRRLDWPDTANPYRAEGSAGEAADRRAAHLRIYLEAFEERGCNVMLVAEAFGYRGGRVTGVPLTSERIIRHSGRFRKEFPALADAYAACCESGAPLGEATASIVWKLLEGVAVGQAPLCWNVVPVHPHSPDTGIWSNRPPRRSEVLGGAPFAKRLIELFRPETVVAVGRHAERGLMECGVAAIAVRHPSNGGARQFTEQVQAVLERYA